MKTVVEPQSASSPRKPCIIPALNSQHITQVLKDSSNSCHGNSQWSKYDDIDDEDDDRLVIDLDHPAYLESTTQTPIIGVNPKMSTADHEQHEATVDKGLKMKIKRKSMHSANKQAQDSSSVIMGKGNGNSMNTSEHTENTPSSSPTSGSGTSGNNPITMPSPFEKLKQAILEREKTTKGVKNVHHKKEHHKKGGSPLGSSVGLGSPSGNPSGMTVNGVQDQSERMGSGPKRDLSDPYEFNVKVEDSRSMGFPVGKKLKVEKHDGEMQRDIGTDTCDISVITEPDLMGPCEPGTSVVLEGIVWQETASGLLVVNITWRGKTYVGALLDATKHEWAPPSFRSDSPTDPDNRMPGGRGGGRGKRGRQTMNSTGGRGRSTRSQTHSAAANSDRVFAVPASPIKSENLGKRRATQAQEEVPPAKRTRSGSATPNVEGAIGEDSFIECPEPNCGKRYRHINGLKYHQSHAHKDVMLKLQSGDSMDVDETSNQSSTTKDSTQCDSNSEQVTIKKEKKKKNKDGKKKKGKKSAEQHQQQQQQQMQQQQTQQQQTQQQQTQQQQTKPQDEETNTNIAIKQEDSSKSVSFKQPTVQLTPVSVANKTVTAPIATVPVGSAVSVPTGEQKSKKSKDKSDKKCSSVPKSASTNSTPGTPGAKAAVIGESTNMDNLKEQKEKKSKKKKKDKNRDKQSHSHDVEKSDSKEKDKDKPVNNKTVSDNGASNTTTSSVIKAAPSGLPQPVVERSNSTDSQPINLSNKSSDHRDKQSPSQTPVKQSPLKVATATTPDRPIKAPESVQSPAYSDISDDGNDSVPSLDNELEIKKETDSSSSLQKVVVGTHPGTVPVPSSLQYPSQPPSLTPVFSQGTHHKSGPVDARSHSIINLTKDKEGDKKDVQSKEGGAADSKPQPGQTPASGISQYGYSFPYGMDPNYHLHLMSTNPQYRAQHEKYVEEQKRKQIEMQKKKEQGSEHRPSDGKLVDPSKAHRTELKIPSVQHSPGVHPQRPDSRERKEPSKDRVQTENQQILKENLELKRELDERRPVPDSPEARQAYEQRMRMLMYQQQQQQQQHYQRLMEQQKGGSHTDKKSESAAGAPPKSDNASGSMSSPKPRGHPQEEIINLKRQDSAPSTPTGPPKPIDGRRPDDRLRSEDRGRGSPSPRNTPTPSKDASVPRSVPTSASPYGHPYYSYGLPGHPMAYPGMSPFMPYPGSPYLPQGAAPPHEGKALELLQQHASQYYNRDGRPGDAKDRAGLRDEKPSLSPSREQLERCERERAIAHAREMEQRGSPSGRHLPPTSMMMSPHAYAHPMYAAHYPGAMMSSPQAAAKMGPPK